MIKVLFLGAMVTMPAAARAESCSPAVSLNGDVIVVGRVSELLRQRGLAAPTPNCPSSIVARLERRNGAIIVTLTDPDGRDTSRRVEDVATVATLIEAFVMDVLPAPVLRVANVERDVEQPRVLVVAPAAHVRGALAIVSETSVANDGSMWTGVSGRACAQLGPICAGGQAHVAIDLLVSGDAEAAEATREAGDLQLFAEWPVERADWTLLPAVGLGVGWLHMRRDVMSDVVEVDAGELRASARVTAEVALSRSIRMTFGVALDLAPTARTTPFVVETQTAPGEPSVYAGLQIGIAVVGR